MGEIMTVNMNVVRWSHIHRVSFELRRWCCHLDLDLWLKNRRGGTFDFSSSAALTTTHVNEGQISDYINNI